MALLGPNGAGKSTLIKILATLVTPDSGTVTVKGKDTTSHAKEVKKIIGLVNTNDRSFYWRLSGKENLQFFGHLYNLTGKKLQSKIEEVISLTGLQKKQTQQFGTYSSGERQRLGIARALLSSPEILLMDEATANLDPLVSEELISFTRNILVDQEGKTVIWCSHNLNETAKLCDKIVILNKGCISACGSKEEIAKQVRESSCFRYHVVASSFPDFMKKLPAYTRTKHPEHKSCTIELTEDQASRTIRELFKHNINIYSFAKEDKQLEETFKDIILNRQAS